jgi:hypothetical protein
MAEVYTRLSEMGQIFGGGNPIKVYAQSYTAAATDTITIPGINNLISCVVTGNDVTAPAGVVVASNVPTITTAVGDVNNVLILYN